MPATMDKLPFTDFENSKIENLVSCLTSTIEAPIAVVLFGYWRCTV